MHSLFQILSDWCPLFYKPCRQETTWKANQASRKHKRIVKHKCWYFFYGTWLLITSTSTGYPLKPQSRVLFLSKNALIVSKCSPFYRPYRQETTWIETRKSSVKKIWRIVEQTVDCLLLTKPYVNKILCIRRISWFSNTFLSDNSQIMYFWVRTAWQKATRNYVYSNEISTCTCNKP